MASQSALSTIQLPSGDMPTLPDGALVVKQRFYNDVPMHKVCLDFKTVATKQALAAHAVPNAAGDNVIDDILLVGAVFAQGKLSQRDDHYLAAVIREGSKLGWTFPQAPEVTICNMRYNTSNHDFLASDKKTKLAVICNVFFGPLHGCGLGIDRKEESQSDYAHKNEGARWHEALVESGALYAANVRDANFELPTDKLAKDPYRVVRETGVNTGLGSYRLDLLSRI